MYYIKSTRTKQYLKSIHLEKGELEFTRDQKEALDYGDSWKPNVELEMLRFNFRNEYPLLDEMNVVSEYQDDEIDEDGAG